MGLVANSCVPVLLACSLAVTLRGPVKLGTTTRLGPLRQLCSVAAVTDTLRLSVPESVPVTKLTIGWLDELHTMELLLKTRTTETMLNVYTALGSGIVTCTRAFPCALWFDRWFR